MLCSVSPEKNQELIAQNIPPYALSLHPCPLILAFKWQLNRVIVEFLHYKTAIICAIYEIGVSS